SECWTTSPPRRSRSAGMCWPGERFQRWPCATRCSGSCPAPWGTRTRPSRSRSAGPWTEHPSTRTTPVRRSTAAGRCRRCCSPDTTPESGNGGWSRVPPGRRPAATGRGQAGGKLMAVRYHEQPAGRTFEPAPIHLPSTAPPGAGRSPMSTLIDSLENAQLRRAPAFNAGDRVRVHFQVVEGTRRRTQVYEGVVIKRQGHGLRETFTVRKQSFGVGVERTFPLHSPKIERIEVASRGDVRRAKLYYLRGRVGKRARVRERRNTGPEQLVERELLHPPPAPST